ncbi:putative dimethylarginine dimethylaminohydrolase [Violaceomyces palustris]|uniref:Dimethylarginine dimethylaminohydrolase n=1 Tax=Violaceomyces palustris TaxID=1673888 RepID=A0ACD0NPR6_9BASI|nr:putative dimethylarginine dimethylaminohydrolase [Violaceomyces palustris]
MASTITEKKAEPILLVRPPSSKLVQGQITHIERSDEVSYDLARQQWQNYVKAFSEEGWKVKVVDEADDQPDCVFVEDSIVFFKNLAEGHESGADRRDLFVLASPGTETRVGELKGVEKVAEELRSQAESERCERQFQVERITKPGTLDGGDILKIGKVVYVGKGTRTNEEGIRQLASLVGPLGYKVVPVTVNKALHLKSAVTALPDGTVIGYPPIVDDPSVFPKFLAVPEPHGVAVVVLSEKKLVISSGAPKTIEMISALGYELVKIEITEFEKLEGCVTCLSVRVRA